MAFYACGRPHEPPYLATVELAHHGADCRTLESSYRGSEHRRKRISTLLTLALNLCISRTLHQSHHSRHPDLYSRLEAQYHPCTSASTESHWT